MELAHRKIVFAESVFGRDSYCDSYAMPGTGAESARPVVAYIGGSISDGVYEARRRTAPLDVANEFAAASGAKRRADLLVFPFPPPSRTPAGDGSEPQEAPEGIALFSKGSWQDRLRERFAVHLVSEVLRARELPYPSSLAFVGFSAGAYLAVSLALDLPKARGAAVFGGTGMAEALAQPRRAPAQKRFMAVTGDNDPLAPDAREFSMLLGGMGMILETAELSAGHDFHQYAIAGGVRRCFEFALDLLSD